MTLELDWKDVLSEILPEQNVNHPIMVILENSCQQLFTIALKLMLCSF